jgi:hypothetical protein
VSEWVRGREINEVNGSLGLQQLSKSTVFRPKGAAGAEKKDFEVFHWKMGSPEGLLGEGRKSESWEGVERKKIEPGEQDREQP